MLFELGQVVVTDGIMNAYADDELLAPFIDSSLARYQIGDWGEICQEDKMTNEAALESGDRLFGSYENEDYTIWIITERDRSVTTILFPEEY